MKGAKLKNENDNENENENKKIAPLLLTMR